MAVQAGIQTGGAAASGQDFWPERKFVPAKRVPRVRCGLSEPGRENAAPLFRALRVRPRKAVAYHVTNLFAGEAGSPASSCCLNQDCVSDSEKKMVERRL